MSAHSVWRVDIQAAPSRERLCELLDELDDWVQAEDEVDLRMPTESLRLCLPALRSRGFTVLDLSLGERCAVRARRERKSAQPLAAE
jgi:hypothetical protein